MDFIEVPEIANVVTVEGSPCMSPMDQDHLIYQQLYSSGEKSGDIKGYECYGDSPDHGYESDTINQKTCFNDFTEGRFTDILTPSTGTYNCTSAPMLGSNVSTMMPVTTIDEGPAPLKIEPSDDFAGWTSGTESYSELDYIDLTIDSLSALSSTSIANYDVTTTCNMTYASPQLFQQPVSKCEPNTIWPYKVVPETQIPAYYTPSESLNSCSPYDDALLEISDNEQETALPSINPAQIKQTPETTAPKRRRRKTTKQPILWRFLLDALNQPEKYGKMIQWVDIKLGTFQFTSRHKEELSKDWGIAKKNRCTMTYQKMARALRNYINRGEVLRKVKRKLQYTFLPEFYRSIHHMVRQ
ncbi:uncharacterized protein LOC120339159 [Styela clava]